MAVKILIVDDEPDLDVLIRQRFRRQVQSGEWEFAYAANGRVALAHLETHPDCDIVLTDINMPEMDGLTLLVHLNILNPIARTIVISAYGDMANVRTAMNNGAFDFVTKPIDFDDLQITIEKTVKFVSQLRTTVRSIKENALLKMYVDRNILQYLTREAFEKDLLHNELVDATVVFVDIRGFTGIAERQEPDTVVRMLNDYFDVVIKAIIVNDGDVDKFIGDAVMAVFRGEGHLWRAVKAAVKLREALGSAGAGAGPAPDVAVGINSGPVVAGNVGSRSLRRFDFTVIGDVVNTASRLEGVAKGGQIVVSRHSYERIADRVVASRLGEVEVKNKTAPIEIYNIVSLK